MRNNGKEPNGVEDLHIQETESPADSEAVSLCHNYTRTLHTACRQSSGSPSIRGDPAGLIPVFHAVAATP